MTEPGTKVFITEDCREGGTATGQVGIYEGDFALTIMLGRIDEENERIDWHGEYWYEDYASGKLFAITIGMRTVKRGSKLSAPSQTVFCYLLANRILVHRQGSVFMVNTPAGNRLKVRKLPRYHEHRALSILRGVTQMRGSTSTPTQDDQSFLQECLDLQTLIAHTERLLHSGRQITPLAAAQMAATRQAREQRAARRAARQGA